MRWVVETRDGCIVTVKATPRASRSEIAGADADWLRVRLQAPPADGKANAALIALLAEAAKVPRRSVALLSGETGRLKRVAFRGLTAAAARQAFAKQ